MNYAPSIQEKKERLAALAKQLEQCPVIFSKPSCAVLLAELRWEKQEISDIEREIRANFSMKS